MSIKEKLKKSKKAIVMGALSLAAVVAPVKGQSQGNEPTAKDTITETAGDQAMRKQLFETAVKLGAPKEEIVKYMDFPEFIPTTKDGQFDKEKAQEWSKILAPYMETLAKKGPSVSAVEAYEAFKKTTGQKNVSLEDFVQLCEMTQKAADKYHDDTGSFAKYGVPVVAMLAGMFSLVCARVTGAMVKDGSNRIVEGIKERGLKNVVKDADPVDAVGSLGVAAIIVGIPAFMAFVSGGASFYSGKAAIDAWTLKPEQRIYEMYNGAYGSYVDQTIKNQQQWQQQKFKVLEWEQAKQLIQNTKGAKQ